MSENLPITWDDKVNNAELLAFLAQYGNKEYLTAEEINQLRDAINELDQRESTFTNPFLQLFLIDKGSQNGIPNTLSTLQVGDVVRGFAAADVYWKAAYYLGGDPNNIANYKPMESSISVPVIIAVPAPIPIDPPPPGTPNYSSNYSPIHYKIYN